MDDLYTKPQLRRFFRVLFKSKTIRTFFCRFLYFSGKPHFFGPVGQEIGKNYSKYLSKQPIPYPQLPQNISPYAHIQWAKETDFSNKKVALIAHFDKEALIDPYVVYYAKHLKDLGYLPVLTTVNTIHITEIDKELFSAIVYRTSSGYDFTSHKAAFTALPSLYNSKELLMTNDSIFAPFQTMAPVFQTMEKITCDFWGICELELPPYPFLHSYFILFKEKTLKSQAFYDFIQNIVLDDDKNIACGYEEILTAFLIQEGLKAAAYMPADSLPYTGMRPLLRAWRNLLQWDIGFVKRLLITEAYRHPYYQTAHWKETFTKYGYPIELVENYLERTQKDIEKIKK